MKEILIAHIAAKIDETTSENHSIQTYIEECVCAYIDGSTKTITKYFSIHRNSLRSKREYSICDLLI